jgi:hypothetical protein
LCGDLEEADQAERAEIIRRALTEVGGQDDYLELPDGEVAAAAAAVLASQTSQEALPDWANAPTFLAEGGRVETAPDLAFLALRALDRVMGEQSEWRNEWEGSEEWATMEGIVTRVREALSR